MGAFFSRILERLRGPTSMRVLMLGFDNVGKTTILYRLAAKQQPAVTTESLNVETMVHQDLLLNIWDVSSKGHMRPSLWRHYFPGTRAFIFVVDSCDRARIDEARQEIHKIMSDREVQSGILLIFANKQDLPDAMSLAEIEELLQPSQLPSKTRCHLVASCATTSKGLCQGLDWLVGALKKQKRE